MPWPSAPTLRRSLLALLLLAPTAGVVAWLSARREPPRSRFDDALDRALSPVIEQSDGRTKLGLSSSRQARAVARALAKRSIPYLAARDLALWADTRERVAATSTPACAKLWKGGDDAFFGPALASLGDEPLQQYVEMLGRALALRLEGKTPQQAKPDALAHGFEQIAAAMPEPLRESFAADVRRRDVSDARACELFRALSQGAAKLDPAVRSDFYRELSRELPSGG